MISLSNLIKGIQQWKRKPYFGFIQGHTHLSKMDLIKIKNLVGRLDDKLIKEYENCFAAVIGNGYAVSFAAARMGFYALMKVLDVKPGEEIVLQGSTCSVMVNAIKRIGAKVVFADIDPDTFGSTAEKIADVINDKTRMIVAQHSFGLPCKIKPIVKLARSKGIFLLEDCALSLGSKYNNITVGNFGDAAIFSTDHSKPLNTIAGGLVYTLDRGLHTKILSVQDRAEELPLWQHKALWKRLIFEREYCRPSKYGKMKIMKGIKYRLNFHKNTFLEDDYSSSISVNNPYPTRFPAFLASLGLIELSRWPAVAQSRKDLLEKLIASAKSIGKKHHLPNGYMDLNSDVIPLRLAWSQDQGKALRKKLFRYVDVDWTWFMQPIVAVNEPLEQYGYKWKSCPNSELVGPNMINLPCNIDTKWSEQLNKIYKKLYSKN